MFELVPTGFVVTFIVVSNGVITAGKTTPLRSIACKVLNHCKLPVMRSLVGKSAIIRSILASVSWSVVTETRSFDTVTLSICSLGSSGFGQLVAQQSSHLA